MCNISQIALPSRSVHNYQYNKNLEAVHMNLYLTHDPWLARLARSQVKQSFASNEACKLTMSGTRGDILYQCGAGGVHPIVVSSIPLKKTLVCHIVSCEYYSLY